MNTICYARRWLSQILFIELANASSELPHETHTDLLCVSSIDDREVALEDEVEVTEGAVVVDEGVVVMAATERVEIRKAKGNEKPSLI